jgi:hypothetical protein
MAVIGSSQLYMVGPLESCAFLWVSRSSERFRMTDLTLLSFQTAQIENSARQAYYAVVKTVNSRHLPGSVRLSLVILIYDHASDETLQLQISFDCMPGEGGRITVSFYRLTPKDYGNHQSSLTRRSDMRE